jgi:outer membrane protein assembly factor BamD
MTRPTTSLLLAALLAACAGSKDSIDLTKPVTGAEASNAAKAYEKGLLEKKDQNFQEATRYFEYVRSNFPYSQYSALAELALADMAFDRDDYGQAAAAYQDFVKSHPSHPKADYAAFRVGLAHYQDKPSDWFLLPPSHEKDQAPIRQALDSLQRFVTSYPKSEFVPKARDMINDCRERLAAHERYVADFYWKKEAWRGAAGRLMTLADSYGDLRDGSTRGESLWRAAAAWRNAKDVQAERVALQRLVQESPRDPHRKEAEELLKRLPAEAAPPAPEMAPKPAKTATQPPAPAAEPVTPPPTPPLAQPDK